jgi:hypothetical protein
VGIFGSWDFVILFCIVDFLIVDCFNLLGLAIILSIGMSIIYISSPPKSEPASWFA